MYNNCICKNKGVGREKKSKIIRYKQLKNCYHQFSQTVINIIISKINRKYKIEK